jgi:hypothetical protein
MNERLRVAFDEPSAGWLQLELRAGERTFRETFSHIYSSLGDLCEALCDVLIGKRPPRRVLFLLEPAECEMCLEPHDDRCQISVVMFADHRRNVDSEQVFEFEGMTADIVLPFWRALRRLETALSESEFAARWGESFPKDQMSILTDLLVEKGVVRRRGDMGGTERAG